MTTINPNRTPSFNFDDHSMVRIRNDRVGLGADIARQRLAQAANNLGHEVPPLLKVSNDENQLEDDSDNLARRLSEIRAAVFTEEDLDDPDEHDALADFWDKWDVPTPGLSALLDLDVNATSQDYLLRLAERNEDKTFKYPDEVLANIMERYLYNLAKFQAEFDESMETYKENFRARIRTAIELGWIPASVADKLDRIDSVTIVIDDGFYMENPTQGDALSLHKDGVYEVVLAEHVKDDPERVLTHELVHILEGANPDDSNGSKKKSGMYKLFQSREAGTLLNEAVVEHLADALYTMIDVDTIHPGASVRTNTFYEDNRYVLDGIANLGKQEIDIRLILAAYFEDGNANGSICTQFLKELARSFEGTGFNVIDDVESFTYIDNASIDGYPYANRLWKAKETREGRVPAFAGYVFKHS